MRSLSRGEAEQRVAEDGREGLFLVRDSTSRAGAYALTLVHNNAVSHHLLALEGGGEFTVNGQVSSRTAHTLEEAIAALQISQHPALPCPLQLPYGAR